MCAAENRWLLSDGLICRSCLMGSVILSLIGLCFVDEF